MISLCRAACARGGLRLFAATLVSQPYQKLPGDFAALVRTGWFTRWIGWEEKAVKLWCNRSVVKIEYAKHKRAFRSQTGGSGVVWDDSGNIVTNYHVIEEAYKDGSVIILVTLSNGREISASIVDITPEHDLVVLRIHPHKSELYPATLGTSSNLKLGQQVYAVGGFKDSPTGQPAHCPTYIIGLNLRGRFDTGWIENLTWTRHSIGPGSSGGALVDSRRRLIGIIVGQHPNTLFGIVIPIDTVKPHVERMIRDGNSSLVVSGAETERQKEAAKAQAEFKRVNSKAARGGLSTNPKTKPDNGGKRNGGRKGSW